MSPCRRYVFVADGAPRIIYYEVDSIAKLNAYSTPQTRREERYRRTTRVLALARGGAADADQVHIVWRQPNGGFLILDRLEVPAELRAERVA